MMTLYMLFTYLRSGAITLDSELVVTPYAASQAPTKLGLKPGATIRTRDAIYSLVTLSANDAAVTIAENLGGTEQNFARAMTQKARALGMSGTTFYNASGLPNDGQITTARDMAILAQHLIRDFPEYYGCFRSQYFTYKGRRYRNHNRLLFNYAGTDGIKTGYIRAAGFNLTASVHRDNKHLVAVVLGGRTGAQRDAAMRSLLDASFPKATAGSPAPLVASVEGPPPPPAPKKQVYALADAGSGIDAPSFARQAEPESDAEDASPDAAQVNTGAKVMKVAAIAPTSKAGSKTAKGAVGPFHVQVGAYTTPEEAESRLDTVSDRAGGLLAGHAPLSVTFMKDDTQWYRARFAGFSQDGARSTCEQLKRLSLDCVVMRAN
jgi:D-alanyl-D-alanine carboxypeptidase